MLNESNKPTNPELWSKAKALAKKKFDVYPSAYANGWAAKWYKGKGGGWKSKGETKKMAMNESRILARAKALKRKIRDRGIWETLAPNEHAATLADKMKSLANEVGSSHPDYDTFMTAAKRFAKIAGAKEQIKEEVVNQKHKGTMTAKERSKRDRIAKGLKGIKAIKGKDSEKNAKYRYATYLVLRARGGESKGGEKSEKPNTKKKKTSKKKS
jgi:hypothetical protein